MEIELSISKAKVGPLIQRYMNGDYQDVEQEKNGVKRVAVLGLDNSHSKDYKVAYASSPMTVIEAPPGYTHDQIEQALREMGVWDTVTFIPIEIPHGQGWKCGFKTTPEHRRLAARIYNTLQDDEDIEDHELLGDKLGFTVYWS